MNIDGVIDGVIKGYMEHIRIKRYSPQTIRHYDYALRRFLSFLTAHGITRLQDVTHHDLERYHSYLMDQGLSLGSQENLLRSVRKFFNWLEATNRLFIDPAKGLAIPKRIRQLLPVPTEEELISLLAQPDISRPVGIRDRTLMEVAYSCGLRRSELAGLSVFDPDINQATLRVMGKGNKERVVPLGKQAMYWLKEYLNHARPRLVKKQNEALWISIQGTGLGGYAIRRQIKEYTIKARIKTPMNLHSLRRACATHMLRAGAHPVEIQMLLGHANLKHLSQYLSVTITDMKKTHSKSRPGR